MDALATLTAALADRNRVEREFGAGGIETKYRAHDSRYPHLAASLLRNVTALQRARGALRTTSTGE